MPTIEEVARARAEQFRTAHGLGDVPIKDMFETVHSTTGIDVLSTAADQTEHGLSMIDPQTGTIVIAVTTTPNPMRQRSSIGHELGHVLAGDLDRDEPLDVGVRGPQEIAADAFSRHLMVPLTAVVARSQSWGGVPGLQQLSDLVQEFGASPAIVAIQLKEAGLIDPAVQATWSKVTSPQLATPYGWLAQYESLADASRRARAPQKLMTRAVAGYRSGVVPVAELAEWYSVPVEELAGTLGGLDTDANATGDGEAFDDDPWAPSPLFDDAAPAR